MPEARQDDTMETESLDTLLDRDGHVTELTVVRYLANEFDGDLLVALETHVASDAESRERVDAARAFSAARSFAPPPGLVASANTVVDLGAARRRRGWFAVVGALAAAAAVLLMMNVAQTPEPIGDGADTIQLKGSVLTMEVFVESEASVGKASTGQEVHPGDKLGFRVTTKEDGHLMIVGVDERNEVYSCYPQAGGASGYMKGSTRSRDLRVAVELDEVLGAERIVAVYCPRAFDLNFAHQAARDLKEASAKPAGRLGEACVYESMVLTKTRR